MAKNSYDTPADDQSLTTGQRSTGPGGGLSRGRNSDANKYYPSASKRDNQGYKGPVGAEGVRGFAGQDGSIPSNEYGIDSKWDYLSDKNLTPKELLSGDYKLNPKAARIAAQASGGINAKPYDGSRYQGGEPADDTRKQTAQGSIKTTPEWLRRRSG